MSNPTLRLRAAGSAAAAVVLALSLAACAPGAAPERTTTSAAQSALPSAHVHGLSVGADGKVLLATHEGLFDVTADPVKVGPTIDLMGFTAAKDPGTFYASGHPGHDSTLPNPVGLIRSTDGGATWEEVSRQGESDFHTLTTTKSGIVAFDGTVRISQDGSTWEAVNAGFAPAALAGNPESDTVLATTEAGIQRSTDGGRTWALQEGGPVIQFAAFAGGLDAVGVEPNGTVHTSSDGGTAWAPKGRLEGQAMAVAATGSGDSLRIFAATSTGVFVSDDGGASFQPHGG
ncbi:F510_1955 family glycosylhydrolase [Pseudarthrobacter sp. NPDC092419]|uniref:F510_1955 family glycosylhydrolase n=1 Tax=Pseudarthrobacter sp. NPDC092419 TaxID=3364414 RepID=UPI00381733A8